MKVVGIDIAATGVRAVRLERRFRDLEVVGIAEERFSTPGQPAEGEVEGALAGLKKAGALEGELCITALPGDRGYVRVLEVPPADAEKTSLLVRNQLDGATPEGLEDEALVASQILKAERGKPSRVLAVVSSIKEVAAHLARVQPAGVDPQIVSCEAAAVSALAARMAPREGAVFVDLSYDRAT